MCSCSTLQIAQKKSQTVFFCDVVRLGGCNGPYFGGCWGGLMVYVSGGRGFVLEADIFSGIPRVTGILRDGKQNRYELRDWDGRGKYLIGSGRDRE